VDEFHRVGGGGGGGGKLRVSRDAQTGEVIACIRKQRFRDLNVVNSTEIFDFRVSVSSEENCEL
jgi:hypothetical protein